MALSKTIVQGVADASVVGAAADVNQPAANTAAVVTYAAPGAGKAHVIDGVAWSMSGALAAPVTLTIESPAATVLFAITVTAAGPGSQVFPSPKKGADNGALIVTLPAGGAGVSGKVSVLAHWVE